MAIGDEDIRPSVIVEIYKLRAEAQGRNANWPKSRRPGHIRELVAVIVVIEVIGIVGEVRLHDVRPAVVIVIC